MLIFKRLGFSFLILLVLLVGCDTDDNSSVISDIDEIDIELESTSYDEMDLPEIKEFEIDEKTFKCELINPDHKLRELDNPDSKYTNGIIGPGKYKMRVGEAFIYKGKYVYFQRTIDSDGNKVRIYLDPKINSSVEKHTTFGTLLTEYNFRVVVEVIRLARCDEIMDIDIQNSGISSEEYTPSDRIVGLYIGRLISIFVDVD